MNQVFWWQLLYSLLCNSRRQAGVWKRRRIWIALSKRIWNWHFDERQFTSRENSLLRCKVSMRLKRPGVLPRYAKLYQWFYAFFYWGLWSSGFCEWTESRKSIVPTKLLGTPPFFSVHSYGTTCPRKNAITLEPLGLDFFPFFPE